MSSSRLAAISPPGRRERWRILERAGEPLEGFRALFVMNHEDGGVDCPDCAWPDDPSGLRLDIYENGVKHVTWELAPPKADREFFAAHTVEELAGWNDHDLEAVGRLAGPMSYDPASDTYLPISWDDAFAQVGEIPANYSQGVGHDHQRNGREQSDGSCLGRLSGRRRRPGREAEQRRVRGRRHRGQLAPPHLRQPELQGRRGRPAGGAPGNRRRE
jgi:hypothetical protein